VVQVLVQQPHLAQLQQFLTQERLLLLVLVTHQVAAVPLPVVVLVFQLVAVVAEEAQLAVKLPLLAVKDLSVVVAVQQEHLV
jgi:hypothetical protein